MKKYPFSFQKHHHDIVLYRNFLFNQPECGNTLAELNRVDDLLSHMWPPVAWLTGPQLSHARKIVFWADEYRAGRMRGGSQ